MSLLQATVLGFVQGVTEFLPVSSSGHLVLFQTLFKMKEPMIAFDVALHAATLLVVVVYFWKDVAEVVSDFWNSMTGLISRKSVETSGIQAPHKGLWICILITMIPTGIMAVLFKDFFEKAFSNLFFVVCAWLVMGILLILSRRFQKGQKDLSVIHYGDAFWIGLVQGVALMPGISRSGSTILVGLLLGLRKETAAKFSFLMSIPAVLAACVLELRHGAGFFLEYPAASFAGFAAAVISGYFVIRWLMSLIQKGRFYLFGFYCIAVGLFSLVMVVFS
ncbi:MAG TPA: undecaprenyl-diphosphatase UppP [Candidatus Omnitrophota bacterium]|nr:undecaprenyl-diphosphatase UppP [Candidatus Omnitrophota bacterium]